MVGYCVVKLVIFCFFFFFFSSRRRHTRSLRDWSSDVCSSDLTLRLRVPEEDDDVWSPHLREHRDLTPEQWRSEEHTSELQSRRDLVCRLLLEKKKKHQNNTALQYHLNSRSPSPEINAQQAVKS